jgi:D-alanyl-D-alanine carboxypeptidase
VASPPAPTLSPTVIAALRAAVEAAIADGTTPGMAIAITDRERTLYTAGFGFAEVASRRRVGDQTLFEIGSIGKSFTAFCVMALVEEGRLDLDDPVERHLPWFRVPPADPAPGAAAPPITLHHLLSHTAGITAGIDATPDPASQVWALRDLRPSASPGERFHYSNVGYKALGLVLEAVEGRPYPEILRDRVLAPLGMGDSEPEITNAIRDRLAVGYAYRDDDRIGHPGIPIVPATWLETATADGSIASTAGDMARYARLLLGRGAADGARIVSEAAFDQMTAPHAALGPGATYGYGLMARRLPEPLVIGHGGGMVGYLASVQVDPEAGIGAVVLQNGYGAAPVRLSRLLIEITVAAGRQPVGSGQAGDGVPAIPATPDTDPPAVAPSGSDLAGDWVPADAGAGSPFELIASASSLAVRIDGAEVPLEPRDEEAWLAPHPLLDHHLLVADRATGETHGVALWHGGVRYVRRGSSPRALPAADPGLEACAGTYRSHTPWTTNFRVVVRGDGLWLSFAEPPDGFDDEAPLIPLPDGTFRVGEDEGGPERLAFDTVIDGRPVRALLSGWPYYRAA